MLASVSSFVKDIPVWGWFDIAFTAMVLIGVCGEVDRIANWVAKFSVPKGMLGHLMLAKWKAGRWKHWAESLLIFGIAGEIVCLAFSLNESAQLNKEASDANAKAEFLRQVSDALESEADVRTIEIGRPVVNLKQFAGTKFAIIFSCSSPDCPTAALSINNILHAAGWDAVAHIPTCKAMQPGIFVGICSTNAKWCERTDKGERLPKTPLAVTPKETESQKRFGAEFKDWLTKHDPGFSVEELFKFKNGCATLVDELSKQQIDVAADDIINFRESLRFNGVVIFIGRKPTIREEKLKRLELKISHPSQDVNQIKENFKVLNELLRSRPKLEAETNLGGMFVSGDTLLP